MRQAAQPSFASESNRTHHSRLLNGVVVAASLAMFIYIGSGILPVVFGMHGGHTVPAPLYVAFFLNIGLMLLGWRRSKDLQTSWTAQHAAERLANELAYTDETTGLFNRRFLFRHLGDASSERDEPRAMLLIDLDHFKTINDIYGHSSGDALLAEVACRLRRVAGDQATCARLGGDEFAILLEGSAAVPETASEMAEALLTNLSRPIVLESTVATIGASIGLAVGDAREEAEWLLRRTDIAMYEAKRLGRNCAVWFSSEMEDELNRRNALETDMRSGLLEGRFVPYFQPLMDLATGEVTGFEVLARWEHPTRGIVEPADFIELAETTGLISELSLTVMRTALLHARAWSDHLTISVNISPVQFKDTMLASRIIKILTETGFPAKRLELEVTESTLLADRDLALSTVESLKNQGIRISLDDFGTGYASLSQLRALPFDRIKIDKSFVASLLSDKQSNAIIHAIAILGANLDLPITAEGVENVDVERRLKSLGCSHGQGWLFGKAISAQETAILLNQPTAEVPAELAAPSSDLQQDVERRSGVRRVGRG